MDVKKHHRRGITQVGAASKLGISQQPVGGEPAGLLAVQPIILIKDIHGLTVRTDSTTEVTVAIQSGVGGTLGGTKTVTAVNGVATFTDLTLAGVNSYVLRFTSDPALTAVDSSAVTVAASGASLDFSNATNSQYVPLAA
jgi:hypothetical protein